jgi:hypothetical protein
MAAGDRVWAPQPRRNRHGPIQASDRPKTSCQDFIWSARRGRDRRQRAQPDDPDRQTRLRSRLIIRTPRASYKRPSLPATAPLDPALDHGHACLLGLRIAAEAITDLLKFPLLKPQQLDTGQFGTLHRPNLNADGGSARRGVRVMRPEVACASDTVVLLGKVSLHSLGDNTGHGYRAEARPPERASGDVTMAQTRMDYVQAATVSPAIKWGLVSGAPGGAPPPWGMRCTARRLRRARTHLSASITSESRCASGPCGPGTSRWPIARVFLPK